MIGADKSNKATKCSMAPGVDRSLQKKRAASFETALSGLVGPTCLLEVEVERNTSSADTCVEAEGVLLRSTVFGDGH